METVRGCRQRMAGCCQAVPIEGVSQICHSTSQTLRYSSRPPRMYALVRGLLSLYRWGGLDPEGA